VYAWRVTRNWDLKCLARGLAVRAQAGLVRRQGLNAGVGVLAAFARRARLHEVAVAALYMPSLRLSATCACKRSAGAMAASGRARAHSRVRRRPRDPFALPRSESLRRLLRSYSYPCGRSDSLPMCQVLQGARGVSTRGRLEPSGAEPRDRTLQQPYSVSQQNRNGRHP
jgi:hypothetical protein